MTVLEIFLLARIEECEKAAAGEHLWSCTTITHALPCDCGLPARVLAECASKRRIMDRWGGEVGRRSDPEDARGRLLRSPGLARGVDPVGRRALMIRHGASCSEDPCDFCQNRAEERASPEPLSDGESARMDDAYEAALDAPW